MENHTRASSNNLPEYDFSDFEHVSGLSRTFHLRVEVIGKLLGLRVSGAKVMENHTQASSNNLPEYDYRIF